MPLGLRFVINQASIIVVESRLTLNVQNPFISPTVFTCRVSEGTYMQQEPQGLVSSQNYLS